MRCATLVRDYRTQHHDPITLSAGECVVLGERDTEWPEFIWGTDPRGKSGWVHQNWINGYQGTVLAARDYSARELQANAGERVYLLEEAGGWWWTENECGECGWLPTRDLNIQTS